MTNAMTRGSRVGSAIMSALGMTWFTDSTE